LFSDANEHGKSIKKLAYDFKKSDDDFITAFKNTYSDELPPSWMLLEITSFGTLSELYKNLKPGKSKRQIAHHFGLDDTTFASWIHSFTYVRNVCAHHSRFWNRGMSIKPKIPLNPGKTWLKNTSVKNNRAYFVLSMMLYLLQSIDAKHSFIFRLKILLKKYPNIDLTAMGFPKAWDEEPLWQFKPSFRKRVRLAITTPVK
jgi:abortive infection bacteriophage resistance protein